MVSDTTADSPTDTADDPTAEPSPLDACARAATETSLGLAILSIRRLNVIRREDTPLAPVVDKGMDMVGQTIEPATKAVSTAIMAAALFAPEAVRRPLLQGHDVVAQTPRFARLAGLMPRK